jgi:hypothetical protein
MEGTRIGVRRWLRVGTGLLVGCLTSTVAFLVTIHLLFGGLDQRRVLTVSTWEQHYFYGTIGWVILGALMALVVVSITVAFGIKWLTNRQALRVLPYIAAAGFCALPVTLGCLFMVLLIIGQPGIREVPDNSPAQQSGK